MMKFKTQIKIKKMMKMR